MDDLLLTGLNPSSLSVLDPFVLAVRIGFREVKLTNVANICSLKWNKLNVFFRLDKYYTDL